MCKKIFFILTIFFTCTAFYAQNKSHKIELGFYYGYGNELRNDDFTHTNNFYKIQICYLIKETRKLKCELVLQPELNLSTHQLIDPDFITPDDPDYIEKREKFTKLRNINQYILNLGLVVRKPISNNFSVYILVSVGPMIMEKETERLAKGFVFSDVIALGFSIKINTITFDVRPSFHHDSNAGLQSPNLGFNTKNIEFGFSFPL